MSKRVALGSLLLLLSLRASTESYPGGEIFGGFSYSNAEIGPRDNFLGWQMSFSVNPHRHLRLVGDFGGQYMRIERQFFSAGGLLCGTINCPGDHNSLSGVAGPPCLPTPCSVLLPRT